MRTLPGTLTRLFRAGGGRQLPRLQHRPGRRGPLRSHVGDVQDVIQTAMGGMNVTETVEGLERYPVNLRYERDFRNDLPALERVLVPLKDGAQMPSRSWPRSRSARARRASRARTPGAPPGFTSTSARHRRRHLRRKAPRRRSPTNIKLPAGLQHRLERPVRIHAGGQAAPDGHHPADRADHLRHHLPEHQAR